MWKKGEHTGNVYSRVPGGECEGEAGPWMLQVDPQHVCRLQHAGERVRGLVHGGHVDADGGMIRDRGEDDRTVLL